MSDLNKRVETLTARIEKTKKMKIQNEVIRDQTLASLEKAFKVDNYEDAEKLLGIKQKKRKKLGKEAEQLVTEFEEDFGEYLTELGV